MCSFLLYHYDKCRFCYCRRLLCCCRFEQVVGLFGRVCFVFIFRLSFGSLLACKIFAYSTFISILLILFCKASLSLSTSLFVCGITDLYLLLHLNYSIL